MESQLKSILSTFTHTELTSFMKEDSSEKDIQFHLEEIKALQTNNPLLTIGGSCALYIHGCNIKRSKYDDVDLDLIIPYFHHLQEDITDSRVYKFSDGIDTDKYQLETKSSGCDFKYQGFMFTKDSKCIRYDLSVEPLREYELISFKGHQYKVATLSSIIEYKIKYSKNNKKHSKDLKNMLYLV